VGDALRLCFFGQALLRSENIFRAVFASTEARKNELLYFSGGSPGTGDFIKHMIKGVPPTTVEGAIGSSGLISSGNQVIDIAWLADASGFISSQNNRERDGLIYRYIFADKALTLIAEVKGEAIGKLAISPDGSSIVFERGREFPFSSINRESQCPCSLWVVNMDGSGMRKLVDDGRAPAWGKKSLTGGTNISPIDEFYNWAEAEYPQYFSSHQTSQDILGYYARHYPTTDIYLGTKDNRVFVYGKPFGGLLDAGDLQGWLQKSGQ